MQETKIADKNIETIEGNKLIADFMGWESKYHPVDQIHSSWDWLMPVIEKIEGYVDYIEIYIEEGFGIQVKINMDAQNKPYIRIHEKVSKIEAVWMAAVKYIKIYNENKIK